MHCFCLLRFETESLINMNFGPEGFVVSVGTMCLRHLFAFKFSLLFVCYYFITSMCLLFILVCSRFTSSGCNDGATSEENGQVHAGWNGGHHWNSFSNISHIQSAW